MAGLLVASSLCPWASEQADQKTRHRTCMPKGPVISCGPVHDPVDRSAHPEPTFYSLPMSLSLPLLSLSLCHPDTDSLSYKSPRLCFFSRKKLKRKTKPKNQKPQIRIEMPMAACHFCHNFPDLVCSLHLREAGDIDEAVIFNQFPY